MFYFVDIRKILIYCLFLKKKIESVNLVKTDRGTGHRGFGFVEFEDRESLITALSRNDTQLLTRTIRVHLKEMTSGGGGAGGRGGNDGPRNSDLDNDWRKKEPTTNNDQDQEESNDFNRPRDFYQHDQRDQRGGGSGGYQKSYQNYNRNRDRNNDQPPQRTFHDNRNQNTDYNDRRNNRQRQSYQPQQAPSDDQNHYGDRNNSGRFNNNNREGGSGFKGRQSYQPRFHENNEFNKSESNAEQEPQEPAPVNVEKLERPKLILQPRSIPSESPKVVESALPSIFGGAKPVDTAARERAIEEKLKASEVVVKPAGGDSKDDARSVHNDDDAKSTTASIDHSSNAPSQQYHQQHKSYRSDHSEHSGNENKPHRNDQPLYNPRNSKNRNYKDSNRSYESSEPTSPPHQQQQQQHQSYHNTDRNQRHSQQPQQQRRQNYQQNDAGNSGRSSAVNRPANDEQRASYRVCFK